MRSERSSPDSVVIECETELENSHQTCRWEEKKVWKVPTPVFSLSRGERRAGLLR